MTEEYEQFDETEVNEVQGEIVPMPTVKDETEVPKTYMELAADDNYVRQMERAAGNIERLQKAMFKIMVSITQPGDWIDFEGTACLTSAGAERYLRHFAISIVGAKRHKVPFEDTYGKGYQWVYEAVALYEGRQVPVMGKHSTRDKLLGWAKKPGDEKASPKPLEDIKETDIMTAAYHNMFGAAVKAFLGLRGIETERLREIFTELGGKPDYIRGVRYQTGSQGGSKSSKAAGNPKENADTLQKLTAMLREMHNNEEELMKAHLIEVSTFTNDKGVKVSCDSLRKLSKHPKWVFTTYGKVKEEHANWKAVTGGAE